MYLISHMTKFIRNKYFIPNDYMTFLKDWISSVYEIFDSRIRRGFTLQW